MEAEAKVVRMVFEIYTQQGLSINAIARLLNEQQLQTRTGKGRWERSTVWGTLRNPAYRGNTCYGKTEQRPRQRVTRSLRQRKALPSREVGGYEMNMNAGFVLGAGLAGQPLFQKFGRTATTNVYYPWGSARYDSVQSTLERRFAQGYSLKFAYTFSKNIGMCCGDLDDGGPAIYVPQYYNLNKAVLQYDIPQNLSILTVAQLPFGKGKRWFSKGGLATSIVSGWQVNGVTIAYSGNPVSVTASSASLNTPGNTQRANQVLPNVGYTGLTGTTQSWFNPLAFAPVTNVAFGTAGFDTVRGPGAFNQDASIFREFSVKEKAKMQFRFDAFNATNTPHFGNPGVNVSNMLLNGDGSIKSLGGYTTITSTKGQGRDGIDQRVLQFAIHIRF
jgi:hypothetical protein